MAEMTCEAKFEVHHYAPRFSHYAGSSAQLIEAGVLPPGFEFPASTAESGWACKRWSEGGKDHYLAKRYLSGHHQKLDDRHADYWWLRIVDESRDLCPNIVELWRLELQLADKPKGLPCARRRKAA